jgi:predicted transcriptional regulator
VADVSPLSGDLQAQVMATLWRIGAATVAQVRDALPPRYRGAYTTVQTVLNRLADRGLVSRERGGQAIVYRATLSEAQYLSRSIAATLASASPDARSAVLAQLIGGLRDDELAELQRLADDINREREDQRR